MRDLTVGNEAKLILRFAIPLLLGNIFQQLYSVVDSIIVGRYIGKAALAACGASFPIIYILIAFVIGIGSGATVVISQYFGARNEEKVRRTISTVFIFFFWASVLISILGIYYADVIFRWLNTGPDVIPQAVEFLRIYLGGLVFMFGFNGLASVLRGLGDSKTPMYFLSASVVLNILLDFIFILGLGWGIAGAAWATVISQAAAFLATAIYLLNKGNLFSFGWRDFPFDREIFKKSLKIGLPTGFQQVFVALGMVALIRIVNNFDTSVLAAYTAASRIDAFAAMPALTLASALSAFVGQNVGANKTERVRKGYWAALGMATIISLLVMLAVFIFGKSLISIFSSDIDVITHGIRYLYIVCTFYLFFSAMFILHGLLRGAGDTLIPMFITLISLWLVRIPIAVFLSHKIGPDGIWWSIPIGWVLGLILSFIYYRTGRWKKKTIVKPPLYEE